MTITALERDESRSVNQAMTDLGLVLSALAMQIKILLHFVIIRWIWNLFGDRQK